MFMIKVSRHQRSHMNELAPKSQGDAVARMKEDSLP
jgi:hypothetical protein